MLQDRRLHANKVECDPHRDCDRAIVYDVGGCSKSRNTSGGGKELNGMDLSLWGYASLWSIMVQLLVVLAGCGSSRRPRPAQTSDTSAGVTWGDWDPDAAGASGRRRQTLPSVL